MQNEIQRFKAKGLRNAKWKWKSAKWDSRARGQRSEKKDNTHHWAPCPVDRLVIRPAAVAFSFSLFHV